MSTRWERMTAQERYDDLVSNHVKGHPVSASTYTNHQCRCGGCCQANTDRVRLYLQRHPEARRAKNRARQYPRLGRVTFRSASRV